MAKKVYVMFGGMTIDLPTFETANPDSASIQRRHVNQWDVKRILTDKLNQVVTIGDYGFKRLSDFEALEKYFGLPADARGKLIDTRERSDVKGLREQYLTLAPSEMVIVVYQGFPSHVFAAAAEQRIPRPLTIQDFFAFVAYEVRKECLPVWGRTLLRSAHIVDAISLHDDWYAVWKSETKGYGDPWCGDDHSYTTDEILFINKNGTIREAYQDSYDTWDNSGILQIRLSRSGKSIVVSYRYPDEELPEVVIPLSQYLSG